MADAVADRDNSTLARTPIRDDDNGNNDNDSHSPLDPFQGDQQQQQQHRRRRPILSRTVSNVSRPREATELDEIASPSSASTASLSSGEYRATPRHSIYEVGSTTASSAAAAGSATKQRFQALRRFWSRHITLNVAQKGNRDYFALERTFLAYMRTAATFSMQGVLVAQIFRLRSSNPNPTHLNFHSVGVPISVAFQVCAILIALIGAYRFWRQQNAIARGKIISKGWELNWVGLVTFLAILTLFVIAIVITAEVS